MATSIGVKLKMDGESEFRKGLNDIISSTKSLDKQMGALESTFKDGKKSMEDNEKQTDLLEKKQAALEKQIEEVNKALEYARSHYAEGSKEISSWESALADAQKELAQTNQKLDECSEFQTTATSAYGQLTSEISDQTTELEDLKEAYINAALEFGENSEEAQSLADQIVDLSAELEDNQSKLEAVTQAAEDLASGAEEPKTALEELTDEITNQQDELDALRDEYVNAVLEFGEGSAQADELAGKIGSLSTSLQENKNRLADATSSADQLSASYSEASEEADNLGNQSVAASDLFSGSIGTMASIIETHDVASLIGMISSAISGVTSQAVEMASEYIEAMDNMVISTGLTGEALDELSDKAVSVYDHIVTSQSIAEVSDIMAELNTRLGLTGDEAALATDFFAKYADTLGINGVQAVDAYVDMLYQWGVATDDQITNLALMATRMDQVALAQSMSKASTEELQQAISAGAGEYQALGLSITDALALIVAYNQAGGSTSDITSGMSKAVKKLSEETDDVPGTFQKMIDAMSSANSVSEGLSMTVGDTGLTIQDILGKKAATAMVNTFMNGKVETDKYAQALRSASGTVETFYSETRTAEDYLAKMWDYGFKSSATDRAREIIEDLGKKIFGIGDSANDAAQDVQAAGDQMVRSYSDVIDTLETPATLHINAPVVSYRQTGSGAGTQFIPYSSGTYRFAQAYDQAMILSAPTIFGASGNQMLVGGDRPGNEVVVGEQHLMKMMTDAIKDVGGVNNDVVINVYGAEGQSVQELAELIGEEIQHLADRRSAVYG